MKLFTRRVDGGALALVQTFEAWGPTWEHEPSVVIPAVARKPEPEEGAACTPR